MLFRNVRNEGEGDKKITVKNKKIGCTFCKIIKVFFFTNKKEKRGRCLFEEGGKIKKRGDCI